MLGAPIVPQDVLITSLCPVAVRYFLYGLVLIATSGRVELWIVPNLTNDKLGVVESFKPLYSVKKKRKKEGKKGGSKVKGSDQESSDQEESNGQGQEGGDGRGQEGGDGRSQDDDGDGRGQEDDGDGRSQDDDGDGQGEGAGCEPTLSDRHSQEAQDVQEQQ